jgi:hypothetical protein
MVSAGRRDTPSPAPCLLSGSSLDTEGIVQFDPYSHKQGTGWVLFAWIIMAFAGVMSLIYGASALANSAVFADGAEFLVSDLRTWGWITLVLGVVQLFAAASIWKGGEFGRWVGIIIAGLNILAQMGTIQASPFWTIVIIGFDLLVIYALAIYGGRREPE